MVVTIKQIAERAGLSVPTVSQILNNKHNLYRSETVTLVMQTAKELEYQPNLVARSLAKSKTNTIGLLTSFLRVDAILAKLDRMDVLASDRGYQLILGFSRGEGEQAWKYIQNLASRKVDGFILYGPLVKDTEEIYSKISKLDIPVVFMDSYLNIPARQVYTDKAVGMREAVSHLVSLGHRDIRMLMRPWIGSNTDLRFTGFVQGLKSAGIDPDGRISEVQEKDEASFARFFKEYPTCTAICCSNDYIAMKAMRVAGQMGINIPKDLSVIGFDDIEAASYTFPALSTVAQPRQEVGERAFEMLMESLDGNGDSNPSVVTIPAKFIARETTGSVRSHV